MKHAACERCARSVGMVNVVGNTSMILIKAYMGVVGGSKGLIADAIHSCADLLATIIMIIGLKISGRQKDDEYPYGYGKAEYLVAIVIYLFLCIIAVYILYDGIMAIVEGRKVVPCMSAAWGAIFSIAINELMFRLTVCAGTQVNSHSMVAKAWESRSDVFSSIAVLIGILGAKMGFHFMDPLAAIAVGLIILKICIEMVKDSVLKLMDKIPEADVVGAARKALATVRDIVGIKDVRAREMGPSLEFEILLHVHEDMSVSQGERIKREVKRAVREVIEKTAVVKVMLFPV